MSANFPPPLGGSGGGGAGETGDIVTTLRSSKSGYLECDGSAVSRTTYADLWTWIQSEGYEAEWGSGDGSTTFNLPDFRGRAMIGAGTGTGLSARSAGEQSIGAETHALTESELPSHSHTVPGQIQGRASGSSNLRALSSAASSNTESQDTGGDSPHNNMQPSFVARWFIKT